VAATHNVEAAAAAKIEEIKIKVSGVVPGNGHKLTAWGSWIKKAIASKNCTAHTMNKMIRTIFVIFRALL
jgi:hypothetical protein